MENGDIGLARARSTIGSPRSIGRASRAVRMRRRPAERTCGSAVRRPLRPRIRGDRWSRLGTVLPRRWSILVTKAAKRERSEPAPNALMEDVGHGCCRFRSVWRARLTVSRMPCRFVCRGWLPIDWTVGRVLVRGVARNRVGASHPHQDLPVVAPPRRHERQKCDVPSLGPIRTAATQTGIDLGALHNDQDSADHVICGARTPGRGPPRPETSRPCVVRQGDCGTLGCPGSFSMGGRLSQTITRSVYGTVAFRYAGFVTVPGKGGRPRKWRSDADRVRAHRARQRGEQEPVTFEAALVDGDELARAVDHARQSQAELVAASEALAEAEVALQTERRRHQATQRKLDRARAELDGRRSTDERRLEELRAAHDELDAMSAEIRDLGAQLAAQRSQPPGPNRAARRQAAKRDRHTER